MLTLLVLPLLVCTIVTGLGGVKPAQIGGIGAKAMLLYLALSFTAAAIGITSALALRPGAGFPLPLSPATASRPTARGAEWIPDVIIETFARGNYLAIVGVTMVFAVALAVARRRQASVAGSIFAFFNAGGRVTTVMLRWVMLYAPIGIFALSASLFGQTTAAALAHFVTLFLTMYLTQVVMALLLGMTIAFAAQRREAWSGLREVVVTAFSTGSSAATLPVELRTAEQRLGAAPSVLSFTLPLGLAVSKAGSAIYISIAALFAANAGAIPLTAAAMGWILLLSVAGSLATPPGGPGALVMLTFVFTQARLPLSAISVIAAVPLIGRLNAPVNSLGRLAVTSLLNRSVRS